jgi:predicted PP-loop superfamily ATPase
VNPVDDNFLNPETGKPYSLRIFNGMNLCESCHDLFSNDLMPSRNEINDEMDRFFNKHNVILFAYSGGLDSTIVLFLLNEKCRQLKRRLVTFTVETGVKGIQTQKNIENVLDYLGLRRNHLTVDVSNRRQNIASFGELSTFAVYKSCFESNQLACGKICNSMLDHIYLEIMEQVGTDMLMTGGDTPKKNLVNKYSVFWKKSSGITIVRGGFAFGLNKFKNRKFVQENRIPWQNPGCGGYDTDCLFPGAYFRKQIGGEDSLPLDRIIKEFPIILEYLAERTRFEIYSRAEAMKLLSRVDIANDSCFEEFQQLISGGK